VISRQQAQQQIEDLIQKYKAIPKAERPNLTEANVLHQFIDPLLRALGWPPCQPQMQADTTKGRHGGLPLREIWV